MFLHTLPLPEDHTPCNQFFNGLSLFIDVLSTNPTDKHIPGQTSDNKETQLQLRKEIILKLSGSAKVAISIYSQGRNASKESNFHITAVAGQPPHNGYTNLKLTFGYLPLLFLDFRIVRVIQSLILRSCGQLLLTPLSRRE